MTATEFLSNLSGGVESRHATEDERNPQQKIALVPPKAVEGVALVPHSGSSAPPAQKLCADCDCEIDPGEDLCVVCWFARNDENPDGRWVNTEHGWLYE